MLHRAHESFDGVCTTDNFSEFEVLKLWYFMLSERCCYWESSSNNWYFVEPSAVFNYLRVFKVKLWDSLAVLQGFMSALHVQKRLDLWQRINNSEVNSIFNIEIVSYI